MFQGIGRNGDLERHSRQLASSYVLFAVVHVFAGAWAAWWLMTQLLWLILLAIRWLFAPPDLVLVDMPVLELPELEELSVVEVDLRELDEGSLETPGEALAESLEPPSLEAPEPMDTFMLARRPHEVRASELAAQSGLLMAIIGTTGDEHALVSDLFSDGAFGAGLDDTVLSGGMVGTRIDGMGGLGSGGSVLSAGGGGTAAGIGTIGRGGGGAAGYGALSTRRRVTKRAAPDLTQSALEATGAAVCTMRVTVDPDGRPTKVSIRSCPSAYTSAAKTAALAHRWERSAAQSTESLRLRMVP